MPEVILVEYQNKKVSFLDIARMSTCRRVTSAVVYVRWKRLCKPMCVDKFIQTLTRPVTKELFGKKKAIVDFDGEPKTYKELAEMYNVTISTISRIAVKHNHKLKPSDIKINRNTQKAMLNAHRAKKEDNEISNQMSKVGWAERLYFPDTGKNGYTSTSGHIPIPCRVVKQ
jgi:hypothetical protein